MKLYTLSEASKVLDKSRQWLWILVQINKLKAEKVGNIYIVREDDLLRCKASLEGQAVSARRETLSEPEKVLTSTNHP